MDGRAFIKQAVHDLAIETKGDRTFDHFIMNLPATAIEFLGKCQLQWTLHTSTYLYTSFAIDAFKGIYNGTNISSDRLPMIHVHCFTRSSDPHQDIEQVRISSLLKIERVLKY